jgi:uncharacterized protein (TIGR02594 family)
MSADDWKKVQRRLLKLGFNPGSIDGIRGRRTVSAVKRFQESRGLLADGIVGPKTYGALFGDPEPGVLPNFDESPWHHEAIRLIGTREIAGPEANKVILEMAETINIDYPDDDIPWCGLFVGHCIASSLGEEPLPVNPLGARNWLKFGEECEPQSGAVLVFWRVKKSGWLGHVGFYQGEDATHYHVLGGNQSNSVSVVRIEKKRLLGARWPLTAGVPSGTRVAGGGGVLESENEA